MTIPSILRYFVLLGCVFLCARTDNVVTKVLLSCNLVAPTYTRISSNTIATCIIFCRQFPIILHVTASSPVLQSLQTIFQRLNYIFFKYNSNFLSMWYYAQKNLHLLLEFLTKKFLMISQNCFIKTSDVMKYLFLPTNFTPLNTSD